MAKKKKTVPKKNQKKVLSVAKKTTKKILKKNVKKVIKKITKKVAKKVIKKTAPKKAKVLTSKKSTKVTVKKVISKVSKKKIVKNSSPKNSKKANITKVESPASLELFLTPLDDRLLVKKIDAEKMTPGGLYIPNTVTDVSGNIKGSVVAVGRGHLDKKGHMHPLDVKIGDQVLFVEHAASEIVLNNQDYLFIRESDVLGIVERK